MSYFRIDASQLLELAKSYKNKYVGAQPFPHIYFDNVFPGEVLKKILEEFPDRHKEKWTEYNNFNEIKLAFNNQQLFGNVTHNFIQELNSKAFIDFLEELTGIKNLIPDVNLSGAGLHQIMPGGLLKVHADFNKNRNTNLDRRLNVLIYLNENWKEEYGGHFELWDKKMEKAEVKLLPIFNRMAIFSTTSTSFHGHPDVLNCPENMSRKSIALYYYTNGRPDGEINEAESKHTTIFKKRKNNKLDSPKLNFKEKIKLFIPPILLKLK